MRKRKTPPHWLPDPPARNAGVVRYIRDEAGLPESPFFSVAAILLACLTLLCTVTYVSAEQVSCTQDCESAGPDGRPNIIMVVVDDMRWNEYAAAGHPYLETPRIDWLAGKGATFTNAHHVNPLCSPSRASILTGQYPSRHGIIDNTARNLLSHRLQIFPRALRDAGYETAHIGKWHMGNDPTPRPGYDYWVSFPGQGQTVDPVLYEDGELHTVKGYITDLLTDRAVDFVEKARSEPFFLYLAHKAVHPQLVQNDDGSVDGSRPAPFIPAERHEDRYQENMFPRRGNAVAFDNKTSKPLLHRALQIKGSDAIKSAFAQLLDHGTSETTIQKRAEMMLAVDEGLGRIIDSLREHGKLHNTVILFTSDNGYYYGEHGLSIERRLPYEEATRAPLLLYYPRLIRAATRHDALVSTIDIAPTLLELAGVEIGEYIQGYSFLPVLRGEKSAVREYHMMEYFNSELAMPWLHGMSYRAIRSNQYKYIHWLHYSGRNELYDLQADPLELENIVNYSSRRDTLQALRRALRDMLGDATGIPVM